MDGVVLQESLNQSFFLSFNQNCRWLIVIIALTWERIYACRLKFINMEHRMDASRCIQAICMRAHLFKDCKFGMPSIKFLARMIGPNITQVKPYF